MTCTNGCSGPRSFSDLLRPDLKNYCPASNLAFNEKIKQMLSDGEQVYHFAFGQAPFPIMKEMVDALKENATQNAYLPVVGIPELRQAVCDFHKRHDKLSFEAGQVIVGPGTKELILLMMTVFNGDVLVMSPTWTTYKPQACLSGHQPYTVQTTEENQWRITPQDIIRVIEDNSLKRNRVLILCNPDNPTGTTYEAQHLKAISEVCRQHNIIVISDEIYGRLHYEGDHHSLAHYYPEGTILSTGFSKWASAGGWRLGYHIYPRELEELRAAVHSAASHSYSCAPAPMQYAVAKSLSDTEAVDDYIRHTARIMKAVGEFCHRELRAVGAEAVPPRGGYYMFPDFANIKEALKKRGIVTGEQLCQAIFNEARVALMAGGPAFLRPDDEMTVRLCFVLFDGKKALEISRQVGLDQPLPADFVQKHCKPIHDGVEALTSWVKKQAASL